jgi:hypothetical protein
MAALAFALPTRHNRQRHAGWIPRGVYTSRAQEAHEAMGKSRWHGMSLQERFDARWADDTDTGCHNWTAGTNDAGYGMLRAFGVHARAHRVSWMLSRGPIPPGAHVLHKCDNPACVNVEHLFLGDQRINMADKVAKGRQAFGDGHYRTRLSEAQIAEMRARYGPPRARYAKRGPVTMTALAREYGCSTSLVCMVVRGKRRLGGRICR